MQMRGSLGTKYAITNVLGNNICILECNGSIVHGILHFHNFCCKNGRFQWISKFNNGRIHKATILLMYCAATYGQILDTRT